MVSPQELYGIQMLRGVAALAVVIHHALEIADGTAGGFSPEWLTTAGAVGVDIFFVISGVIMFHTSFGLGRQRPNPAEFLWKRILRIYPFYWLCLAAMVVVEAAGIVKSVDVTGLTLLKSFVLWPGDPIIGYAWTLSYEMLFYLVFAAFLLSRSDIVTAAGTCLSIILIVFLGSIFQWEFFDNPIALEFCLGIAVAAFLHRRPHSNTGVVLACIAAIWVLVAPAFVERATTAGLDGWTRLSAWGVPSALIVAGLARISLPENRVGRLILLLGDASYSLYLTHLFVMLAYRWLTNNTGLGDVSQIIPVILVSAVASV